jgi:iron complex outermembrane receptor protein
MRHAEAIKLSDRDNQIWANGDWSSRGGMNLTRGVPNAQNSRLIATSSPFFYNPAGTGGEQSCELPVPGS